MFTWPRLELTEFEKQYVGIYRNGDKPGVLRRTYQVFLNTVANPQVPNLEEVKLQGSVAISRRTRVFGLTFAGNLGSWRLSIELASGEQMTPRGNADGPPVVSSLIAGGSWNALAAIGDQMNVNNWPGAGLTAMMGNEAAGPMNIDPNWELSPNETLYFRGIPIDNQATTADPMTPPAQKLLSIGIHVWEFPGMDGKSTRMGAGPNIVLPAVQSLRK